MTQYTCALSGQIGPKAYVLKTTEGEELISPEALFHPGADRALERVLVDLIQRVKFLEEQPAAARGETQGEDPAPPDQEKNPPTAAKRTPRQRKAAD